MECVRGRKREWLDALALQKMIAGYSGVYLDLGTGDGKWVRRTARTDPSCFAIGVDACAENMGRVSRLAPENTLFVVANALALPEELDDAATHIAINFPWGSLLTGLLEGDPALLNGLARVSRPGAVLEIRVNSAVLREADPSLEAARSRIQRVLRSAGWKVCAAGTMDACALRKCATTWAGRVAFGRGPHGFHICAEWTPAVPVKNLIR